MNREHDAFPDGRSGPWLRKRHNHAAGTEALTLDNRCGPCRTLIEKLSDYRGWDHGNITVKEAESFLRKAESFLRMAITRGNYGAGL